VDSRCERCDSRRAEGRAGRARAFRSQQEEATRSVGADRPHLLIVRPRLALMRDQIVAAKRMDVRAETVDSPNDVEWVESGAWSEPDTLVYELIQRYRP